MDDWQPIKTAPTGEQLMFWWRPVDGNIHAEVHVLGQISHGEHEGEWWTNCGTYQDVWHLTHWKPLGTAPVDAKQGEVHPDWNK
jgi:hypothetical protein